MSRKVNNEKEIDKLRNERKWDSVLEIADAKSLKAIGSNLNTEELELYVCFLFGEALFEKWLDAREAENYSNAPQVYTAEQLKESFSYINAAITAVKKSKTTFPHVFNDSHLLLAKYHFLIQEYETCLQIQDSLVSLEPDTLNKRSKFIKAEALTCRALSLEALNKGSLNIEDVIGIYDEAAKLALSLCADEEKTASLKRTACFVTYFTKLLINCFFGPGDLLIKNGKIVEAIQHYRTFLKLQEMKATIRIRKTICRQLAGLLLSCNTSLSYVPPGSENKMSMSESMLSLTKTIKRIPTGEIFSPKDECEEALLVLLLSEAILCRNASAPQRKEDVAVKDQLLNETKYLYDLLVLVLIRHDQYDLISQSFERIMKLASGEIHLWFQYGLSMVCDGKYKKALFILQQCHKMQPTDTNVLMFSVKLCLNHLQEYNDAIMYANKVLALTDDPVILASARLAIGMSHTNLACKASTSGKTQIILKEALNSLNIANKLDPNDSEIQFNLAFCQALTKQLQTALATIKLCLANYPDHIPSLKLLALLLSAQKKYHEALEVIETAIEESPEDFSLYMIKVKLAEESCGSQVALVICHSALLLWNNLHNTKERNGEVERLGDTARSPSYVTSKSLNESKYFDGTASIKSAKKSMNDSAHLDTTNPNIKKLSDSASILDDDGNGSIAASIRIERTLSEGASGSIAGTANMSFPTAVALLCKLWLITAECFINMDDLTEAIQCILEASSIFPLSPEVLYMRGRYNESKENKLEAKACYESALSVLPTHKAAAQRLGLLYHEEGNHVLAEKLLRSCILQDSSNHTAWNDLGLILESVGRHEEAANCHVTSLQLESTSPIVPYITIPRLFKANDC